MIYIIGAGWYGCHIATRCLEEGYDVRIVDKANAFFTGASNKNQNRLHLGYHYPRSVETIHECRRGYEEFRRRYGFLCKEVPTNIYLLANSPESKTLAYEFSERFNIEPVDQTNKGAVFHVNEYFIDNHASAEYFRRRLNPLLIPVGRVEVFETIEGICEYLGVRDNRGNTRGDSDIVLNCTYNQLAPTAFAEYEMFITFLYKIRDVSELFGYTVMDGPFFSLYPCDGKDMYTLTSVEHGVVWRGRNRAEAVLPTPADMGRLREVVERQVLEYIPHFHEMATYSDFVVSWKTKPVTDTDDRSLRIERTAYGMNLWGGKITGVFDAAEAVLKHLADIDYSKTDDTTSCCNRMDWLCGPVFI